MAVPPNHCGNRRVAETAEKETTEYGRDSRRIRQRIDEAHVGWIVRTRLFQSRERERAVLPSWLELIDSCGIGKAFKPLIAPYEFSHPDERLIRIRTDLNRRQRRGDAVREVEDFVETGDEKQSPYIRIDPAENQTTT